MHRICLHSLALAVALLLLLLPSCQGQMTDAEKLEAVQFANYLRRNVVPKAGDMNGLLWNERLAGLAQQAADQCKYQHNYDGDYASLGENVYRGGTRNVSEIFMFMYLERENYDYKTSACTTNSASKYPAFTTCGHYLQLVTASVMHMGCGLKQCDGSYLMFCEFNSGYATPPYEAGEPGTLCRHLFASYSQDDLCYYKPVLGPAPVNGTLDCKLTCLNYGTKTFNQYQCSCNCPSGFYGTRCETKVSATSSVPNDCTAQLVSCKNGGTPTMEGEKCKCVCPSNYRGAACEENIQQVDNSIFWYFGQDMRYSSYYPVDPSIWTSKTIHTTVLYYLTTEVNSYCKANYASCCPSGGASTTDSNLVTYTDFAVTDGYPQNVLDGSLKVGVNYRLSESAAKACGGTYVNRNALLAAAAKAQGSIKGFLVYMKVAAIKFE